MDETIGVKGGYNDRRRTLRISKEQKKKLIEKQKEKEIKELEERVRKKQFYTLIKALPIAIGGGTFKILYDTATGKKDVDKQEEYSKWRIKEYDSDMSTKSRQEELAEKKIEKTKEQKEKEQKKKIIIIQEDGSKIIVEVPIEEYKRAIDYPIEEEKKVSIKEDKKTQNKDSINKQNVEEKIDEETVSKDENIKVEEETHLNEEKEEISFENLPLNMQEKLSKLKSRKIIDVYGKQLKDIRYDLRQLIFDYNVLVKESDDAITSKELEDILDRLNDVIDKVETLKTKIQIDNLDKYDDNYIYTLIEDYLLEFKDKKVVSEIKDSPLYILISEKLDELDKKKDSFKKEVEKEKEQLAIKEVDFDKVKEKYYTIDKLNKSLVEFQKEQEIYLNEVKEKINNAVTVTEKVEVQMEAMNFHSLRLLKRLTAAMMFPGTRAARGASLTTAAYLNFVRQILNPKTTTKKYKVVTVSDYSYDIENSIRSIENALSMLSKSNMEVGKLIKQIKEDFSDYLGVLPECDELLSNLEKVQRDLKEKEYEMQKIKKQQERELERNNAKVLSRGEYLM